ncbi:MAG TPA: tetratricopeptide repeat protein, partial [Acidimicrobiales bacterium]|nr:tetratricopeptide repeat protein [Acidimicrobiales bacterium]
VARRGARQVAAEDRPDDRRPRQATSPPRAATGRAAPAEGERWVEEPAPPHPGAAGRPPPARRRRPYSRQRVDEEVARQISAAVPHRRAGRVLERVAEAAIALEEDRPRDALRALRPVLAEASEAPAVRELAGLSLYRLGRWSEAVGHLEAFRRLSGSVDQHPVLADCYRALGRFAAADELWAELRRASPSAALVTEGRIVAAGALADQGQLGQAIRLLEGAPKPRRRPAEHHLRLWYALADLYERVGDTPRARELFSRVAAADPALADTAERLQALS